MPPPNTSYSNVVHVLYHFQKDLLKVHIKPAPAVQYTTGLSIREGKTRLRASNNLNNLLQKEEHLLIYNREPLVRNIDISGIISPRQRAFTQDIGASQFTEYATAYSMIKLNYVLITRLHKVIEDFETQYVTAKGLTEQKSFTVDYGSLLGEHDYRIEWEDMNNLEILSEEFAVRTLSFSVEIYGWFFYGDFTDGIIEQIDLFYKDMNTDVLFDSESIVPI